MTRPGNPFSGALWVRAWEPHSLSQPTKDVPDVSAPPAVRVSKAAGFEPHRSPRPSQALLPGRTDDSQQLGAHQVAPDQRVRQAVVISNQVCQLPQNTVLVVNLGLSEFLPLTKKIKKYIFWKIQTYFREKFKILSVVDKLNNNLQNSMLQSFVCILKFSIKATKRKLMPVH